MPIQNWYKYLRLSNSQDISHRPVFTFAPSSRKLRAQEKEHFRNAVTELDSRLKNDKKFPPGPVSYFLLSRTWRGFCEM